MRRADRDLFLAWMDTNSNYYGTWDYTQHATCGAILQTKGPLAEQTQAAGCTQCHDAGHIGNDWVNLQKPQWSRILRAPMAKSKGSLGAQMCRNRKAAKGYPLVTQRVQPPDVVRPSIQPAWDDSGEVHTSFASTDNPHYKAMVEIILRARSEALSKPRIDMPGAMATAGECRIQVAMKVPPIAPKLAARIRADHTVELHWQRTFCLTG